MATWAHALPGTTMHTRPSRDAHKMVPCGVTDVSTLYPLSITVSRRHIHFCAKSLSRRLLGLTNVGVTSCTGSPSMLLQRVLSGWQSSLTHRFQSPCAVVTGEPLSTAVEASQCKSNSEAARIKSDIAAGKAAAATPTRFTTEEEAVGRLDLNDDMTTAAASLPGQKAENLSYERKSQD